MTEWSHRTRYAKATSAQAEASCAQAAGAKATGVGAKGANVPQVGVLKLPVLELALLKLRNTQKPIVGSSSRANYLMRNAAMDDSIGGS